MAVNMFEKMYKKAKNKKKGQQWSITQKKWSTKMLYAQKM